MDTIVLPLRNEWMMSEPRRFNSRRALGTWSGRTSDVTRQSNSFRCCVVKALAQNVPTSSTCNDMYKKINHVITSTSHRAAPCSSTMRISFSSCSRSTFTGDDFTLLFCVVKYMIATMNERNANKLRNPMMINSPIDRPLVELE